MAVWSKALPLPLTTARIRNPSGACEKVASDLRLGGGFRRVTPVSSSTNKWLDTNKPQNNRKSDEKFLKSPT